MKFIAGFIQLSFALSTYAQNTNACKCCNEPYRQFDFWVGDWNVYDTLGNQVGENTIYPIQDSCGLQENWKSQNSTGTSYNYYNATDSTWNQVWIDNQGGTLILKGNYHNGKMKLQSALQRGRQFPLIKNEITWTKQEDGSVTQVWDILDDQNNIVRTLFYGVYKPK